MTVIASPVPQLVQGVAISSFQQPEPHFVRAFKYNGNNPGATQKAFETAKVECQTQSLRVQLFGSAGNFNKMKPKLRLDGAVDFSKVSAEDHVIEFFDHLT